MSVVLLTVISLVLFGFALFGFAFQSHPQRGEELLIAAMLLLTVSSNWVHGWVRTWLLSLGLLLGVGALTHKFWRRWRDRHEAS